MQCNAVKDCEPRPRPLIGRTMMQPKKEGIRHALFCRVHISSKSSPLFCLNPCTSEMRSLESARASWQELKQIQTLRDLKEAVRLDGSSSIATAGARSICWKVFLLFDTLDVSVWTRTLSSSRLAYNTLRSHFLRYLDNPDEANAGFDPLSEGNDVCKQIDYLQAL